MSKPDVPIKCAVCGENDPWPRAICLAKLTGAARVGEPCQYSVEGTARQDAAMQAKAAETWAEVEDIRARRAATRETSDDAA